MSRQSPYASSRPKRKLLKELFASLETDSGSGRARQVGRWKIKRQLEVAAAAFSMAGMVRPKAA